MNVPRWMVLVALSLPLSITLAVAAAPKVDPDKLPVVACSGLKWNAEFLAKYPKAPPACLEARVYKGKRYAKFMGKVYIQDPAYLTVTFLNVAGDALSTLTYKPAANAIVYVNGKPTQYKDIKVGDKLTFWVSEDRFAVYGVPGAESGASKACHLSKVREAGRKAWRTSSLALPARQNVRTLASEDDVLRIARPIVLTR